MRNITFRFRLKDLFFLTVALSAILACVLGEDPSVAVAAIYCFVSLVGIGLIGLFLTHQTWRGLTKRTVVFRRPFVYLLIATILLTWLFSVIAIANVVVANYSNRAIWLLYASVPSAMIAGWLILRR